MCLPGSRQRSAYTAALPSVDVSPTGRYLMVLTEPPPPAGNKGADGEGGAAAQVECCILRVLGSWAGGEEGFSSEPGALRLVISWCSDQVVSRAAQNRDCVAFRATSHAGLRHASHGRSESSGPLVSRVTCAKACGPQAC